MTPTLTGMNGWRILVRRTTIEVEAEGDAKWPENEIDSPSVHWDGETR